MNPPTICLLMACALLAIGLLGGGFKFRDIEVPKVGAVLRALSGLLSLGFAATSFHLYGQGADPLGSASKPVTIRIENALSEGQLGEHVRMYVNAQLAGTVTVSEYHPSAEALISLRGEGRYSYQLVGNCAYLDADGVRRYAKGWLEGYLDVQEGATYLLKGELDGERWHAEIVKKPV